VNGHIGGVAYLKVVLQQTNPHSKSNVNHIRVQLTDLDTQMQKLDSGIVKFNHHVHDLHQQLTNEGEQTTYLLINLFKGYKAASDVAFVKYVDRMQEGYNDGTLELTTDTLMLRCQSYYQDKVRNSQWSKPDDLQQQVLAFQAAMKRGSFKNPKGKEKQDYHKRGKGKEKDKTGKNGKKWQGNEERRTKTPPATDKLKAKYVKSDKKSFNWCEHHKKVRSTQAPRLQQQDRNGCRARSPPESSSSSRCRI